MSKHISEHGSIYTYDVVKGVLTSMINCMVELLKEGSLMHKSGLRGLPPQAG